MSIVQCGSCGASIEKAAWELRGHSTWFCNRTCQNTWQKASGIHAGENSPSWKGNRIPVVCEHCGKEFTMKPSQFKRFAHRFCSRPCKWAKWHAEHQGANHPSWKGAHIAFACDMCGQEAKKHAYQLRGHDHHFCSSDCRYKWLSECMEHPTGSAHASWIDGLHNEYYGPDWLVQQRSARKRDKNRCQHCGKTQKQNGRALDVHHIRPFRTFGYIPDQNDAYLQANELTNLISLCIVCHRRAEAGNISIQPYLL